MNKEEEVSLKTRAKQTVRKTGSRGKYGLFRLLFSRFFLFIFLLLAQFSLFFIIFVKLYSNKNASLIYFAATFAAVIVMVNVINSDQNPSFTLVWVIPILIFPVFGLVMFVYIKTQLGGKRVEKWHHRAEENSSNILKQEERIKKELWEFSPQVSLLSKYVYDFAHYPIYRNTQCEYFDSGEAVFPCMLEELEKAEKYIYLEFFIVQNGVMWGSILEILKKKAAMGVDVRLIYDGTNALLKLPLGYKEKLESYGIKTRIFLPMVPLFTTYQNNRDHRKILVVDGKVGFTGGINLADEYINAIEIHGYWKDSAILLRGDAVKSLTVMFLQMWDTINHEKTNYTPYRFDQRVSIKEASGFVMPYADCPLDEERIGENIYMTILDHARNYVHIMTPYLIIDEAMVRNLCFTAKKGVEVSILMPHVPDKKYAFYVAKTYYKTLLRSGVKIYEYKPGFVHSKIFVADDNKATVGSVNLDYRSLYLHFECGVYLYRCDCIPSIEADFQKAIKESIQVTEESLKELDFFERFFGKLLRMLAPLL